MVTRIGGFRRKTRGKLSKSPREKGKVSLTKYFQKLDKGDMVTLIAEPSIQKGMYFPRFHGKRGTVIGKVGDCYNIQIKDGNKDKVLIVHPVHMKRMV